MEAINILAQRNRHAKHRSHERGRPSGTTTLHELVTERRNGDVPEDPNKDDLSTVNRLLVPRSMDKPDDP